MKIYLHYTKFIQLVLKDLTFDPIRLTLEC